MAVTVWIIDDDESTCDAVGAMLQELGYKLRTFSNPVAALTSMEKGMAQVILVDIRMPELSGHDLTRSLHAKDPDALIMVLTGYPSIPDAVEAIKNGATDFLAKPVQKEELRIRIEKALQARDMQDRLKKNRSLTWILIGSLPLWFALGIMLSRVVHW